MFYTKTHEVADGGYRVEGEEGKICLVSFCVACSPSVVRRVSAKKGTEASTQHKGRPLGYIACGSIGMGKQHLAFWNVKNDAKE